MFLGIVFEGQNVAFMAGLAFAVAASANFPALLLSITWKRFMTPAAVASIGVGTFSALLMIGLSPTVQVDMLGKNLADASRAWWFVPMKNPAIISMPLSFIVAVAVSLLTREDGVASTFREMRHRIMFGKAREAIRNADFWSPTQWDGVSIDALSPRSSSGGRSVGIKRPERDGERSRR